MKRLFDIIISFLLISLLWPMLIVVSLLIKFQRNGSIIFSQTRIGLNGKPIEILKFRTMADSRGADGHLLSDDLRLTPLGCFLRSSSIDELPQLWNVLKGEMSLVGPRPLLLEYRSLFSLEQAKRHQVRPGITGLAQVNGRNALCWDDKFKLDVKYVEEHNLFLDIKILLLTVKKVFTREGIAAHGEVTMSKFKGNNR